MKDMDILQLFTRIRVGSFSSGADALHKPLLLLLALSRCKNQQPRLATFSFYDSELIKLFDAFYPEGLLYKNTHYPFGKLESDGVWEIEDSSQLKRTSVGHLHKSELLARNTKGGFIDPIYSKLCSDRDLLNQVVAFILGRFINQSKHDQIRRFLGFVEHPYSLLNQLEDDGRRTV